MLAFSFLFFFGIDLVHLKDIMSELWEILDPFNELALMVDEDAIGFFDYFMVQQFLIFCEFIYWEVEV